MSGSEDEKSRRHRVDYRDLQKAEDENRQLRADLVGANSELQDLRDTVKALQDQLAAQAPTSQQPSGAVSGTDLDRILASVDRLAVGLQSQATRSSASASGAKNKLPRFDIDPLDIDTMKGKTFEDWLQRWEDYFFLSRLETETPETQMRALRMNMTPTTRLKVSQIDPNAFQSNNVKTLLKTVKKHIKETTCIYVERKCFEERVQKSGEPVADFYIVLCTLARDCDFDSTELAKALKTRFLLGVNSKLSAKLFELSNLDTISIDDLVKRAKQLEQADQTQDRIATKDFSNTEVVTASVLRGKSTYKKNKDSKGMRDIGVKPSAVKGKCKSCGRSHDKKPCPAQGKQCNFCKHKGHFASVCRKKAKVSSLVNEEQPSASETESDHSVDLRELKTLRVSAAKISVRRRLKPVTCELRNAKGKFVSVSMFPDTGAEVSTLNPKVVAQLGLDVEPVKIALQTADETAAQFIGTVRTTLVFKDVEVQNVQFLVLAQGAPLLSLEHCIKVGLIPRNFPDSEDSDQDWKRKGRKVVMREADAAAEEVGEADGPVAQSTPPFEGFLAFCQRS